MGMKYIKTLNGEYVRVESINNFVIEYDGEEQKFYVMAITAEEDLDLGAHEEKFMAQAALDELLKEINGG